MLDAEQIEGWGYLPVYKEYAMHKRDGILVVSNSREEASSYAADRGMNPAFTSAIGVGQALTGHRFATIIIDPNCICAISDEYMDGLKCRLAIGGALYDMRGGKAQRLH